MPTTSWRINVNQIDKTQTVGTSPDKTAALAIIAPKGNKLWTFIDQGNTQYILNNYGYPSVSYPAVQDLIDLNKHCGTWVSAPYKNGAFGGAFITASGTLPFVSGTQTQTITNYSGVVCQYPFAVGTGVKTSYSGVLPNYQYYNGQSLNINVNGTSIGITVSGLGAVETLNSAQGSGTYTKATGTIIFNFNTPPAVYATITPTYTINISQIVYATLWGFNQQADDIQVQANVNTTISGAIDINVYHYDIASASYIADSGNPYTVGLLPTSKDGYGNNIFINNVFSNQLALIETSVQNSNFTTMVNDVSPVLLTGGNRGDALLGSDLVTYYDQLTDTNTYLTNLIVDATGSAAVAAEFSSLRAGKELHYVSFIMPTLDLSAANIISSPVTAKNSVADRGIFYSCLTWGLRTDQYQGNNFNCSNIGLVASKVMDCMITDPSEQPAYFNENGPCGGQLDSGIISLNQTATQTQLKQLDALHFNPVVIDPQYGAWIVGFRTTQSMETVYAYIAQSVQADLIIKDIVNQVLTPQQSKANDAYHRTICKANTEAILANYSRGLDASFVKCDTDNNNDAIRNQQKFVLSVAIRFVSYAALITCNFVTTPFGVDITTALN